MEILSNVLKELDKIGDRTESLERHGIRRLYSNSLKDCGVESSRLVNIFAESTRSCAHNGEAAVRGKMCIYENRWEISSACQNFDENLGFVAHSLSLSHFLWR